MDNIQQRRRVVIGGGISGLAAACRLAELAPTDEVLVLEAGPRLGGVLQTVRRDGFLIEQSADNFITDVPWGVELCRRAGIAEELIPTDRTGRRALVVHRGRLVPVPEGFMLLAPSRLWPMLTSPLLSLPGKLRLACEPLIASRPESAPEESLAEFATRRLGREVFERIAAPLVAAIYGGDPARLSVAATLPRFLEMERRHGSLLRGARQRDAESEGNQSGARYGLFVAPRQGMTSLVDALAAKLPEQSIRLNTSVAGIEKETNGGWRLHIDGQHERLSAAAVVIATPIHVAGKILDSLDPPSAELCRSVELSSCAVVSLGYDVRGTSFVPPGFGFVVPASENRPILAASFASAKFPHRAPAGHLLVRVFIGGAGHEASVTLDDAALIEIATAQLAELTDLRSQPVLSLVSRWPVSMPQYHVGHGERMERLTARIAALGALALAGNAYQGVGIPQCIRSGESAAEAVLRGHA
ncbi:MAG: protoporphyrinogen oxidase [Planctomycetes bacterium]|nr:protoporphyrinogen oxidase [Planctomycetota bacterium]